MTNEDVVKEIAFWALTRRRNAVGDHFDLSDDELGDLLSWLKEDIKLTIESHCWHRHLYTKMEVTDND